MIRRINQFELTVCNYMIYSKLFKRLHHIILIDFPEILLYIYYILFIERLVLHSFLITASSGHSLGTSICFTLGIVL